MAGAALIGAQIGSRLAVRLGGRLIRPLLVAVSGALAARLLLDPANPLRGSPVRAVFGRPSRDGVDGPGPRVYKPAHTSPRPSRALRFPFASPRSPPRPPAGACCIGCARDEDKPMANTVSAKKMTRKIAKRTAINRSRRSRMRTFLRKVEEAIASGNRPPPPRRFAPPSRRSCAPPRRASCTRTPLRGRCRVSRTASVALGA